MRVVWSARIVLAFAVFLACAGEPTTVLSNAAPVPEGDLPWIQVREGGQAGWFDVAPFFSDPDGDDLTFTVGSGNAAVASVTAEGHRITVRPMRTGRSTVTVTASDPEGLSVEASFRASVRRPAPGSFNIDLILAGDPVTETQEAAFVRATDFWMRILADTELPDMTLAAADRPGCGVDQSEQRLEAVDDLVIVANVRQTNRRGLAFGGPCRMHSSSGLPFTGRILVSTEALSDLETFADQWSASGLEVLEDLVLHEIGHVLGIGTLWNDFIGGASSDDPHFTGARALAAFDEAGGTDYTGGARVPVEERVEAHWRGEVFDRSGRAEVMTPVFSVDASLSAITIEALADMGYAVDVSQAQPYLLPGPDSATAGASAVTARASAYRFGDDILRGPILAVDANGKTVRVVPRR